MNDALRPGPRPAPALALAVVLALLTTPPVSAQPRLTPLMAELLQLVELEQSQLAEIRRSLGATSDRSHRLELERRIEAIKFETELSLLRVQATYARREGRVSLAEKLEASIRLMSAPPAPGVPIERPAPTGAAR